MKFFIEITDGPLGVAVQKVLDMLVDDTCQYVDLPNDADLIIVKDKRELHKLHSKEKYFAIISIKDPGDLPDNCRWIPVVTAIVDLLTYIIEIKSGNSMMKSVNIESIEAGVEHIPINQKCAMHILVIDDSHENLKLALKLLSKEHFVTVATGYNQGKDLIEKNRYDAVLSDCQMPAEIEKSALALDAIQIGDTVHNGLFLMFPATARGARFAIVTDASHHRDWVSAIFDDLHKPQIVNGQPVLFINYIGKRWDDALERLLSI